MGHRRSYSQINGLRTCGEQFRLERVEKTPAVPNTAALAGRVVHRATEYIDEYLYELELRPDDDSLATEGLLAAALDAAQHYAVEEENDNLQTFPVERWKKYGKQDWQWFKSTGIPNCVTHYYEWRLGNPQWTLFTLPSGDPAIEVYFSIPVGRVGEVIGYIDRIFVHEDGQLLLFDIKSGVKPKTDEQLALYARAVEKVYGIECRWGAYVYGLKTAASFAGPIDLSHWTDEDLARVYETAEATIRRQLFIPHPGEACFHCGVAYACAFNQAAI